MNPYRLLAVLLCLTSATVALALGYEVARALWHSAQGKP